MRTPLLTAPPDHDTDPAATDAELAALIELARARGARDVVIGSGRAPNALATASAIEAAWDGGTLARITWPETAASWLRQAVRFAAPEPDLWLMVGPATGWAQMTRRLLWSTHWRPGRTLATAGIGDPRTLALVGSTNIEGLAGVHADGSTWVVTDR